MERWLFPAIFVVVLLAAYGWYATMTIAKKLERAKSAQDTEIPLSIKEHPLLLNPIILSYVIVGLFMAIIIFTYWAETKR